MEFSKTINLPKTNFSMKANLSVTENNWLKFWKEKKIYEQQKKMPLILKNIFFMMDLHMLTVIYI